MKKTLLVISLLAASSAFAADDTYAEISHMGLKYSEPGISAKPAAIKGIMGWKQSEGLAYEALIALGASDGNFRYGIVNGAVGVKSMIGFFTKASTKLGEGAELFARVGIVSTNIDQSASAGTYRLSQNTSGGDFAYGVGLKYSISKDYALVVDYTNYYNKGDVKIQGLGVGVSFNY